MRREAPPPPPPPPLFLTWGEEVGGVDAGARGGGGGGAQMIAAAMGHQASPAQPPATVQLGQPPWPWPRPPDPPGFCAGPRWGWELWQKGSWPEPWLLGMDPRALLGTPPAAIEAAPAALPQTPWVMSQVGLLGVMIPCRSGHLLSPGLGGKEEGGGGGLTRGGCSHHVWNSTTGEGLGKMAFRSSRANVKNSQCGRS